MQYQIQIHSENYVVHHTWINGEKTYIATSVTHGVALEKTLDLSDRQVGWSLWYKEGCENAYTTSNALDRLMRNQNRYFDRGQYCHGTLESAN